MADRIEQFFTHYAQAVDDGAVQSMSECSVKPMIFVSDDVKNVCHTQQDIEKVNSLLLKGLDKGGVVKHVPKVTQSMRLSDAVLFVAVRWHFVDASDTTIFSCFCSYTLQVEASNELKILVVVLDDEQKTISKLMQQVQG